MGDARCVLRGARARRRSRDAAAARARLDGSGLLAGRHGPRWSHVGIRSAYRTPPPLHEGRARPGCSRGGPRGSRPAGSRVPILQHLSTCRHCPWRASDHRRNRRRRADSVGLARKGGNGSLQAAVPVEPDRLALRLADGVYSATADSLIATAPCHRRSTWNLAHFKGT